MKRLAGNDGSKGGIGEALAGHRAQCGRAIFLILRDDSIKLSCGLGDRRLLGEGGNGARLDW